MEKKEGWDPQVPGLSARWPADKVLRGWWSKPREDEVEVNEWDLALGMDHDKAIDFTTIYIMEGIHTWFSSWDKATSQSCW